MRDALDALDAPTCRRDAERAIATCCAPNASHDSLQRERVVEIGERVELNRLAVPRALERARGARAGDATAGQYIGK